MKKLIISVALLFGCAVEGLEDEPCLSSETGCEPASSESDALASSSEESGAAEPDADADLASFDPQLGPNDWCTEYLSCGCGCPNGCGVAPACTCNGTWANAASCDPTPDASDIKCSGSNNGDNAPDAICSNFGTMTAGGCVSHPRLLLPSTPRVGQCQKYHPTSGGGGYWEPLPGGAAGPNPCGASCGNCDCETGAGCCCDQPCG